MGHSRRHFPRRLDLVAVGRLAAPVLVLLFVAVIAGGVLYRKLQSGNKGTEEKPPQGPMLILEGNRAAEVPLESEKPYCLKAAQGAWQECQRSDKGVWLKLSCHSGKWDVSVVTPQEAREAVVRRRSGEKKRLRNKSEECALRDGDKIVAGSATWEFSKSTE